MDARVVSLHRYPVKSLLGEDLPSLDLDARGCAGDRLWSVRTTDGRIGSGKTTRRFAAVPGLLLLRSRYVDGVPVITFPDGTTMAVDEEAAAARLSDHVGQPVTVACESDVSHFDDGPVSVVGTASLAAVADERREPVDRSRFRPNIVLDTGAPFAEQRWVGRQIALGTAVLEVTMASPRCAMVDMATADLPAQPGNLLAVGRLNRAELGVVARVLTAGTVAVGDTALLR